MAPSHVVFVCAANINRSPMAEAVFKAQLRARNITCNVESAGYLPDMSGRPASRMWREIERARAYDLSSHRSKHTSSILLTNESHVVCLDPDIERFCRSLKNLDYGKLRVLCPPEGVFDPIMGNSIEGYKACLTKIENGICDLVVEFYGV